MSEYCDHRLRVDSPWWEPDLFNVPNHEHTMQYIGEKIGDCGEVLECRYCSFRLVEEQRPMSYLREEVTP